MVAGVYNPRFLDTGRWKHRRIYGVKNVRALAQPLREMTGLVSSVSLAVRSQTRIPELIMVVIRLARGGAKKRPFYNIVVADSRERRDGRYIERLGFYNPMAAGGDQPLRIALDRVTHWQGVGAQLSPTVKRLVGNAAKAQVAPAA